MNTDRHRFFVPLTLALLLAALSLHAAERAVRLKLGTLAPNGTSYQGGR